MSIFVSRKLRSFVRDDSGVGALEFALIAPVMVGALLLSTDVGMRTIDRMDMQSAVRTGAQYLMDGGRDMDRMSALVTASWSSMPEETLVTGERYCLCSDTTHVCTTLCGDGTIPESYIRISASTKMNGVVMQTTLQVSETVRIR
jgi:Flp pilus assembly protein TadG